MVVLGWGWECRNWIEGIPSRGKQTSKEHREQAGGQLVALRYKNIGAGQGQAHPQQIRLED